MKSIILCKGTFYFTLLVLMIVSCTNQPQQKDISSPEAIDTASISLQERINSDSITYSKNDSIELHAVDDFYFGKLQRSFFGYPRMDSLKLLRIDKIKFTSMFSSNSNYKFVTTRNEQGKKLNNKNISTAVSYLSEIIKIKHGKPTRIGDSLVWSTQYKNIIVRPVEVIDIYGGKELNIYLRIENIKLKELEKIEREKRIKEESTKF